MRDKENTPENPSPRINFKMPWRVLAVKALDEYCLKVSFMDGTHGEIDMSKLIFSKDAGIFASLKDVKVFKQVHVNYGVVTWPGEIDLAPDVMYKEIKQHKKWTPEYTVRNSKIDFWAGSKRLKSIKKKGVVFIQYCPLLFN
jgi:hypothetical protein